MTVKWEILSPQGTKTSAEADEMLKAAGALPADRAAGLFLTMEKTEYDKMVKKTGCEYPDFWLGSALLARVYYDLGCYGRRFVVADDRRFFRFGVLAFFKGD